LDEIFYLAVFFMLVQNKKIMSQFNLSTYKSMLQSARQAGYRFISFGELKKKDVAPNGQILLRHDVDGDLAAALEMAKVEADLGVFSTYFLMWRSPCYNLLSRSGQTHAESITRLGHQIGLHYDQGFDMLKGIPVDITELIIQREVLWLEQLLDIHIDAVSFHQPSPAILENGINCGERVNTYDRNLLSDFLYVSDSNRVFPIWAHIADSEKPAAIAKCYPKNMQILIHPMWWVYDELSTEAVWNRVLLSNLHQSQRQMLATEGAYGPERRFLIEQTLAK
jgi:hypothetical protein